MILTLGCVAELPPADGPAPCTSADVSEERGLLRCAEGVEPGYTMFSPLGSNTTWLIDSRGEVVHRWDTDRAPGISAYLLPTGNLLRPGVRPQNPGDMPQPAGHGGHIQELAPDGEVVWTFDYGGPDHYQHHDIEPLPSGNVLVLAWERKTADEALAAGRDPALLSGDGVWPEHIVEVDRGGEIVWRWHLWDHLVQNRDEELPSYGDLRDAPGRLNINNAGTSEYDATGVDWNHVNSISYDPARDQILMSSLGQSELWIIDHSTTTEEARGSSGGRAGRGGDLLYRWGNPAAAGHGSPDDRVLSWQHDADVIPAGHPGAGNILVFNNRASPGQSMAVELTPPRDEDGGYLMQDRQPYGPTAPSWTYSGSDAEPLFSWFFSGVQRLPGGNTRLCEGDTGRILEVTPAGEIVWEYQNPDSSGDTTAVFRSTFIPPDHPGLAFLDLEPSGPVQTP